MPPKEPINFIVESFHINIDAGDCAIHLLTSNIKDSKKPSDDRRKVERAVIIDGGKCDGSTYNSIRENINETIEHIELAYRCQGPPKGNPGKAKPEYRLLFNSFVVSHFDADHCDGLLNFIVQSYVPSKRQLDRAVYSGKVLESYFFAPHAKNRPVWVGNGRQLGKWPPKGFADFTFDEDEELLLYDDELILNLRVGTPGLLGTNFFEPEDPFDWKSYDSEDIDSVEALIKLMPPDPKGKRENYPGLYCVGLNQTVLGQEMQTKSILTAANRSSVCCLVIWDDHEVSHYFGGDADIDFELKVVKWINRHVTSMKVSHHGAISSTPVEMLQTFDPANVIVSAGGGSYGHPRWELVVLLHIWHQTRKNWASFKPLFMTQWIKYLIRDEDDEFSTGTRWSTNECSLDENDLKDEMEQLEALRQQGRRKRRAPEAQTFWAAYEEACDENGGAELAKEAKKKFICEFIEGAMPALSSITDEVVGDGTVVTKKKNLDELRGEIIFVRVVSTSMTDTNLSLSDGDVFVKTKNSSVHGKRFENRSDRLKGIYAQSDGASFNYDMKPHPKFTNNPEAAKITTFNKPGAHQIGTRDLSLRSSKKKSLAARKNSWQLISGDQSRRSSFENDTWEYVLDEDSAHPVSSLAICNKSLAASRFAVSKTDLLGVCAIEPSKSHDIYKFTQSLHYKIFTLNDEPTQGKTGVFTRDFGEIDEWQGWLRTINPATGGASESTLSMTATWPLDDKSNLQFSLKYPFAGTNLSMSTIAARDCFLKYGVNESGIASALKNQMTMIFCLNKDSPAFKVSLGDVVRWLGFSSPLFIILDLPQLKLVLDDQDMSKTKPARNGMWFTPNRDYETVTRLQFRFADPYSLTDLLKPVIKDFSLKNVCIIAKRTVVCAIGGPEDSAQVTGQFVVSFMIDIKSIPMRGTIEFNNSSITLAIRNDNETFTLQSIIDWLKSLITPDPTDASDVPLKDWTDKMREAKLFNFKRVIPRKISLEIGIDAEKKTPSGIESFDVLFEAFTTVGKATAMHAEEETTIVFALAFGWSKAKGAFCKGSLWCPVPEVPSDAYALALPDWEEYREFDSLIDPNGKRGTGLDLAKLCEEGLHNIPQGVPTQVVQAELEVNSKGVLFSGIMRCTDIASTKSSVPQISLEEVAVVCGYNWEAASRGLYCALRVDIVLFNGGVADKSDELDLPNPVELIGSVEYNGKDKSWVLGARLTDFNVGYIAGFWLKESRSTAMAVLGNLNIDYLDLQYFYENQVGSRFLFDGMLSLGKVDAPKLVLKLTYEHKPNWWEFKAILGARNKDDQPVTVKSLIDSIIDDPDPVQLPDAISNITIGSTSTGDLVRLLCSESDGFTIFRITVQVDLISFGFMQINKKGWKKPKRIIKCAITEIPPVSVPMFGNVKQPFDQLFYLWVQDKSEDPEAKSPGITQAEFELFRAIQDSSKAEKLFYKKTKTVGPKDVVIAPGHHLIVVTKDKAESGEALIDFVFQKSDQKESGKGQLVPYEDDKKQATESPGAKAPLKKSIGPLSVDSIGLWYKNGRIGITIDATFMMGPIGLALLGFSIGGKFKDFSSPPTDIDFSLDGLIVSFDRPPLTVAGGFMRSKEDGKVIYAGGIIIGFKPWQFEAMGVYAEIPRSSVQKPKSLMMGNELVKSDYDYHEEANDSFTMVFVICKLNGPLFSVGWADVTGLTGGIGVNSDISLPKVDQVVSYPFVKADGTGNPQDSPITRLKNLMKGEVYFRPAEGSYWVAAGFKVTAFQMLAMDTVIVLQFLPSVKLGIVGLATMDVPNLNSPVKFARAELGIIAVLDPGAGIFKLEAQLTPRSFVLDPSCHLTGGMALYSWFKDDVVNNVIAGDWVFTIGGYHQAFNKPSQYPRPPRLGISWSLGKNLKVTGEAYFAITPKSAMAGGRLHASFSAGPLYAYFDAYIDLLINYRPFYFQARAGVAVGVRFVQDLWLVTIRISVEIGASLFIEGPPFGGKAYVNFWVFGFEIKFGNQSSKPRTIELGEFWSLVINTQSSKQSLSILDSPHDPAIEIEAKEKPNLITCDSGLESDGKGKKETQENEEWLVRAGQFTFTVTFQFPINSANFKQTIAKENLPTPEIEVEQDVTIDKKDIFARPMGLDKRLSSKAVVEVLMLKSEVPIKPLADLEDVDEPRYWRIEAVEKPVPQSLWGACKLTKSEK